jgi:hypothetical protein
MKVICPKCQFENQADSTRVVCARCATIIEVRVDQGSSSGAGFDANGKRQTARLPFASSSNNSGNISSGNFGNGNGNGNGNSGSLGNPGQNRDVYATRVGDDFDDVLDIPPRSSQNEYQNPPEATPVFEDVFSTNYDSSANYDYSGYDRKSNSSGGFQADGANQRVTQDYTAPAEPEFMGWPVLPENTLEDDEEFDPGPTSNRGSVIARVGLILVAFGVLSFLAYYFLWDYISDRKKPQVANNPPAAQQNNGAATGAAIPAASTDPNVPKPSPTQVVEQAPPPPAGKVVPIPLTPGASTAPVGPTAQSAISATPNKGNYTLQVGSYPDKALADERVNRLKTANVTAKVVQAEVPGRGLWYRVQVGAYPSKDDAGKYGNQLRSSGIVQDFIVVTIGK